MDIELCLMAAIVRYLKFRGAVGSGIVLSKGWGSLDKILILISDFKGTGGVEFKWSLVWYLFL